MEDDGSRLYHRPDASNPKLKRPCLAPISKPELNLHPVDGLLELLLDSSSAAVDLALNRVVESKLYDEEKDDVIDRATRLASALAQAAKRLERRRMAAHNSAVWILPSHLTIKVFSLLDTKSVCHAAAACSLFRKCSTDPLCFSNIDLTSAAAKVNNAVVSVMIQRAGKDLRSLTLGSDFSQCDKNSRQWRGRCLLTRFCLSPLVADGGASGALLKRLYLYNIDRLDSAALESALSACPGLLDLEIVGLHVELGKMLELVCKCPLIWRIFFESSETVYERLDLPTCVELASSCPCLSSLTLRGYRLPDTQVLALLEGLLKLRYVDLSTSYAFTGEFLRNLGGSAVNGSLECLMLRDCVHLSQAEVSELLSAMVEGRFAHLGHIDVSNPRCPRFFGPSFPELRLLADVRPDLRVIADSPIADARTMDRMRLWWSSRIREIHLSQFEWRRS